MKSHFTDAQLVILKAALDAWSSAGKKQRADLKTKLWDELAPTLSISSEQESIMWHGVRK